MSDTPAPSLPDPAPVAKMQKRAESSFPVFLIKLALFVLILRSFIFAPFSIPSESMLPRLLVGDYLVVAKWPYGYSRHSLPFSVPLISGRIFEKLPTPGDVVVFKAPPGNATDYIKRVIGLPGDMIQMKDGQLFINGVAVKKERVPDFIVPVSPNTTCERAVFQHQESDGSLACHYPQFRETLPNGKTYTVLDLTPEHPYDNTDVYTVPEGHFFAMGDNRDGSADSRYPPVEGMGIGFVPVENLVGRAWFMVFSTDGSASWLLPWTWFTAARGSRIGGTF
jgi:signal peptidase I